MARASTHIDKALTARMLRGDQAAFDQFFHSHFARLYRFALIRIGDDDDAIKEVVQRTLCRAVAKLETFRGEASLFTWLCRLCRNEISDHLKRAQRDSARTTLLDELEVRAVLETLDSASEMEPDDRYRRLQIGRFVQTVLDYLPDRQSTALELKYIQGFSVEEIATRMGVSLEAAQSLLARARRAFRDGFSAILEVDPEGLLGSTGR